VWKERFLRHAKNHQMLARVADKMATRIEKVDCVEDLVREQPKKTTLLGELGLVAAILTGRKRHDRCVHGRRLRPCKKCVEEEKQRKEQREIAKWAEQRRISSEARDLQRSEADRLSKSIIPKLDDLRRLSPQQFENLVAQLFDRLGYSVKQTPYSNDYGRDAILHKDGGKVFSSVQAKWRS